MTTRLPKWIRVVRDPGQYPTQRQQVTSPSDVMRCLGAKLSAEEVEVFTVVMLDAKNSVLALQEVTRGILSSSLVHPREVFRAAIAYGAAGIIVAHNHPSGNPTPSADDKAITKQLVEAGALLDIPVYDHVIAGSAGRFFSFAEAGIL